MLPANRMAERTDEEAITTRDGLREQYGDPSPNAVAVARTYLDEHHRRFIVCSPFVCIATIAGDGFPNVSPRGGQPGFVHIRDEHTLVLPDRPGNNKLETLDALVQNPKVALIFFVPGVRETVRVHGTATLVRDAETLELGRVGKKLPLTSLEIHVTKAYLHCGMALVRGRLWDRDYVVEPGTLPSFGQIIKDQAHIEAPAEEIQEGIEELYREGLY